MAYRVKTQRTDPAFTLIELLIVVAIIAILAAIAVPNFLEAQVRAKVTRVKNDHRTLATALESYFVDYNAYPRDQDNDMNHASEYGFRLLTSPVAYITSHARDPFSYADRDTNQSDIAQIYVLGSGSDNVWRQGFRGTGPSRTVQCWILISIGPNRADDSTGQEEFPDTNGNFGVYDTTNGTKSAGDILRFGGDYRTGTYRLNGLIYNLWSI